ncbi:two-component sensor histidine kinase [Actinoplanes lobatus]|uniref:histidine kinase n=1 Tax=Actinoplanes lobatus TaxID=113568 RepID=A0A7W7MIS5_9ACTN|nr:histidine kinase [Actinoplanes lobatus]MBB4751681.1 signal transduction histidine kinase [Actinoplanes lobatus]GGN65260.1 two-component sensor histidine kinase [Actinoplanes lobatus]GIE43264.1 two-component sensor histidine kinase [Actinoplanes lobatus]
MHVNGTGRIPPWLGDAALAGGLVVTVLTLAPPADTGLTVTLAAVAAGAAMLRRRYPEQVLTVATAVVVLTLLTGTPAAGLFIALGALNYSTALYSRRRRPWFYAATVWVAIVTAGTIMSGAAWWTSDQWALFAFIFGGAGAGDSTRMRRAYIAEVTERARQAEQTREEEARRRVMDERLRIARELHDVVAHHIAVISVHAGAAGHVLRNDPEKVWPVLGHIRQAADTVLDEIKSVIGVLRDPGELPATEPTSGLDRLPGMLAGLEAMGFEVRHRQTGTPRPLPAVVDLAAYRIVQEALTNAHRYGDGSADLDLTYTDGEVTIEVVNRVARYRGRSGSGFGLLGMRERAAVAHGAVTAGPVSGGRFRVHAVLPAAENGLSWNDEPTELTPTTAEGR